MWDLLVSGGRLVIPEVGVVEADVAIEAGRIAAIGRGLSKAKEHVDARGLVVFPGVIDPHIHLGLTNSFASESLTETASGLAAGVTSVGVFLRSLEAPYAAQLPGIIAEYEANARADAFFHLQIFNDRQVEEMPAVAALGVTSFKFYLYGLPGVMPAVDDGFLYDGFRAVARLGSGAIACIHAENEAMVVRATAALERTRPEGTLADWADSHPDLAEAEAIHRAAFLARHAGCRLYIVHLSTRLGLEVARSVKATQPGFYLETTSPLLAIDKYDAIGLLGKMSPPLRAPDDINALWEAVRAGVIDTVGTDNTSRHRTGKRPEKGLHGAGTGYPALGTHLPALLEEGYHRRGVSLETIARAACLGPAKVYGLYPRKGTIAVGADADLALVDLDRSRTVRPEELHSFSDFSLFEGRTLRGWPVTVIKGGQVAVQENEILAKPGTGHYLPRLL